MRKPYWRESCKAFYVLHDGKQHRLGKTKEEPEPAYHKLMAGHVEASPKVTVNDVVAEFLSWTEGHRSPLTYEWHCQFLETANKAVSTVARAFDRAVDEGVLPKNPLPRLKRPAATHRDC